METSRFFVANLPQNTKEKDLRNIFQDYGEIKNIELKTKDNLVDPTDVKVIAFVTVYLGAQDAQYSLNDLNWCKVNGQQIKVSLAKESFLERLKREREEAQAGANGSQSAQPSEQEESELLKAPKQNKRKTFDINVDLGDDDVAIELMVTKKRAANFMFNGKIVIQSQDVEPIHVIETKKKKQKTQMDEKSSNADQKRKESLNKKKTQYQQNKTAIQQALQGLDASKVASKKIKFSDNESDEEPAKEHLVKKSKTNIFGSDEEGDEEDLQIKTMPAGKKGERLVELQAKQSLDPRFRIDAKFVDGEEAEEEENDQQEEDQNGEDDERQWQMNILQQVVGTKLDTHKVGDKNLKNKKMLHYDPSKDEHQKYERSREDVEKSKKPKQKNKTSNEAEEKQMKTGPEVSKEVFYVVTDSLQQSLRTRGEGFSLLDMFGKTEHLEERDEQLKQLGKEKILVNNNKLEKAFTVNPFTYDSSSESEMEDKADQENCAVESNDKVKSTKNKNKLKIATESFFIPKNDKRLKEGSKFFIYRKDPAEITENYEEVRNRLKLLIKNKISKSKKNFANAGYKSKKRKM